MLNLLDVIKPNSIDSVITDPPYELNFMGKGWDSSGIAFQPETWKKCYDALKPGGYLLAFGGSRTFHRIACAIEDAGFEIRDTIMWLYGSGFPKSHNIGLDIDKRMGCPDRGHRIATASRFHPDGTLEPNGENLPPYEAKTEEGEQWQGWGTALKPAFEPIIVARKPFRTSVAENIMKYGVGGINIDECRVGEIGGVRKINIIPNSGSKNCSFGCNGDLEEIGGRFPANVIHDGSEEVVELFPNTAPSKSSYRGLQGSPFMGIDGTEPKDGTNTIRGHDDDGGSASRFFYTAKASKKDRDEGLKGLEEKSPMYQTGRKEHSLGLEYIDESGKLHQNPYAGTKTYKRNTHPCVKPCELMQYLVRLVSPKGATILDPFMGSGSTGKAVMFENRERNADYKFIGIDLEEEYCNIASARIDYALNKYEYDAEEEKQIAEAKGQLSLF